MKFLKKSPRSVNFECHDVTLPKPNGTLLYARFDYLQTVSAGPEKRTLCIFVKGIRDTTRYAIEATTR